MNCLHVEETENFFLLIKLSKNRPIFLLNLVNVPIWPKFSPLSCTTPSVLFHSIAVLMNIITKNFSPSGSNLILTNNFVHWMAHIGHLVIRHSLGKTCCSWGTFVNEETNYHCIRQIWKLWDSSRHGRLPFFQDSNAVVWRRTMKCFVANWVFSLVILCKLQLTHSLSIARGLYTTSCCK